MEAAFSKSKPENASALGHHCRQSSEATSLFSAYVRATHRNRARAAGRRKIEAGVVGDGRRERRGAQQIIFGDRLSSHNIELSVAGRQLHINK